MSEKSTNKRISKAVKIINRLGIHARPAALIVKTASRFDSDITIEKDRENAVSAKSIMGLMTLEASRGTKLKIIAEGPDAHEAVSEIEKLVKDKFYED